MNLSWLWPKLVTPKSRLAKALDSDLAKLNRKLLLNPDDAFIEACERDINERINTMQDKDRLDEIGKLARLILVQTVTNAETTNTIHPYKRYKLQPRDVQAAWDSATEIHDLVKAHRKTVTEKAHEQASVVADSV